MRIGIIFSDKDVEALTTRRLHAAAISPACPVDEERVARVLGVPVFNLNDLIDRGEMAALSRDCAGFIRTALEGTTLSPEALASQNDVYQYHLRKQYLFYTSLKRFLESGQLDEAQTPTLILPVTSIARYESPMRPELNRLFDDTRTFGYVAQQLAASRGIRTEFAAPRSAKFRWLADLAILGARRLLLQTYALLKLAKKVWNARPPRSVDARTVGIIVRTDSEVVSAHALLDGLDAAGIRTLVIQDELLASETTVNRLDAMELSYVAIGSGQGLGGLVRAMSIASAVERKRIASSIVRNLSNKPRFMDIAAIQWARWMPQRLFDFSLLQRHFALELQHLIHTHQLKLLITFAYVDQWGPVIQHTGAAFGIKTICVQNAAQDPEEYPHLAWSDHYCVESTYLKSRLVALGYPENAITATGLPHYTADFSNQAELLPTAHKRAILLVTQPIYFSYYVDLFNWLAPFCGQNGFELHVKYHPRQFGNEYADAILNAQSFCNVKVFHRESLDSALDSARICISIVSAAILRSINYGVPTISFLPKSERYLDLYYCSDANIFVAETLDDLGDILNKGLDDFPAFWEQFKLLRQNYIDNHLFVEPSSNSVANILGVIDAHLS